MVGYITTRALGIIGLFRKDYLASLHVREMARLIGTSHVTLLPHLASLEKEGLLVSSERGRNRVFTLNLSNISAKYALMMAESVETLRLLEKIPLLKRMSEECSSLSSGASIILFGSYASGTFTERSDVDILAVGTLAEKDAKRLKHVGATYGKRIDLKASSLANFDEGLRKGDPLIREVVANHALIHDAGLFADALWRYCSDIRA